MDGGTQKNPWFVLNLRSAMEAKGYENANQLANAVDVHRATAGYWLSGEKLPERETLTRLADCLGVTVNELLEPPSDPAVTMTRVMRYVRRELGDPEADVLLMIAKLPPDLKRRLVDKIAAWIDAMTNPQ